MTQDSEEIWNGNTGLFSRMQKYFLASLCPPAPQRVGNAQNIEAGDHVQVTIISQLLRSQLHAQPINGVPRKHYRAFCRTNVARLPLHNLG